MQRRADDHIKYCLCGRCFSSVSDNRRDATNSFCYFDTPSVSLSLSFFDYFLIYFKTRSVFPEQEDDKVIILSMSNRT